MPFAAATDFTATPIWSMLNIGNLQSSLMRARASRSCSSLIQPRIQPRNNLFDERIRIAFVLGNLGRVASQSTGSQSLAGSVQQRIAQHFDQPILPVLHV